MQDQNAPNYNPNTDDERYPLIPYGGAMTRTVNPDGSINWEFVWQNAAYRQKNPLPVGTPMPHSEMVPWMLKWIADGGEEATFDDAPKPAGWYMENGKWLFVALPLDPLTVALDNLDKAIEAVRVLRKN